jgi:uncharacterized protein YeeX (DUF496 family)
MKDKNKGLNLDQFYFDYQYRNLVIQSVWMMDLWLQLASEYRLKNEIMWELDDNEKYQDRRKYVLQKWEDELKKDHEEMLSNPELEGFHPYFADDPIKEGALGFFVIVAGYGEEKRSAPFLSETYAKNKDSFYIQSRCYYQLSLCYKYFKEIQHAVKEEFEIEVDDCFIDLDRIKEDMWYSTGDLLAYWSIDDKRKRSSKKGGSAPKRLPGILSAVNKIIIEDNRKSYSIERLWGVFEKDHKGIKKAIQIDGFKIYFDYKDFKNLEERIFQLSSDGKSKSIGRSAFNGYVKKAKEDLKKFTSK